MKTNNHLPVQEFLNHNHLGSCDEKLMSTALTHPSFAQERSSISNNQRLEFLGDAVLNFMVAEYLYSKFNDKAEGELTKIRSRVVCEQALMNVAQKLDLGTYLMLGKGEEMSGGRSRKSILADAVEAVIGALYLDKGFEYARGFILKYLEDFILETAAGDYYDYKSRLQELVQAKNKESVTYRILSENGPAHAKVFTAGVFFQDKLLATGQGKSKKEAEQCAAELVLQQQDILDDLLKN